MKTESEPGHFRCVGFDGRVRWNRDWRFSLQEPRQQDRSRGDASGGLETPAPRSESQQTEEKRQTQNFPMWSHSC